MSDWSGILGRDPVGPEVPADGLSRRPRGGDELGHGSACPPGAPDTLRRTWPSWPEACWARTATLTRAVGSVATWARCTRCTTGADFAHSRVGVAARAGGGAGDPAAPSRPRARQGSSQGGRPPAEALPGQGTASGSAGAPTGRNRRADLRTARRSPAARRPGAAGHRLAPARPGNLPAPFASARLCVRARHDHHPDRGGRHDGLHCRCGHRPSDGS
jgi:hypothetical protein